MPWKLAATLLAATLLVGIVAPFGLGKPPLDARDVSQSPGPDRTDRDAPSAAPSSKHTPDPRMFDEYAAVTAALRALSMAQDVHWVALADGDRLGVKVSGTVPTRHVAQLIQASSSERIGVDISALRVEGRYRTRPGDTLVGIAQSLYGDGGAWRKIRDANPIIASDPQRLRPGATLDIPQ